MEYFIKLVTENIAGIAPASKEALADIEPTLQMLGGCEGDDDVIGIGKDHIKMVVAVAAVFHELATAGAAGLDGMPLQYPVADIDHMDVLLHDDIPR